MSAKQDKKYQIESKYNRHFSEEFKKQKVKDLIEKKIKIGELCALYEISRASVYKWLYLYSNIERGTKTVVQMESEYAKTQHLLALLAERERALGQKQLEIDYLETAFQKASEELGYDIKKKYAPPRLSIFADTSKSTATK